MAAGVACGSCGTAQRENAKFCDACGYPLTERSPIVEYKQVTVLFADVVGSMDIAAAVDPERWREIVTALMERSAAVVRRYGGTVEYTGDGVMALFGAPKALEDHAFRACLAALAIQHQTNRLADGVRDCDGVELQMRVGLNSGRVIAGEMGSGSQRYAATGTPVGMAQRMESVAPPGGVMLSESTARLVEQVATLAGPEWVRIKGAEEPVPARRLVAIEPRHGLPGAPEASLVGRSGEMAALDAIVDRTIDGRGAVVNVVGPPGIGKTRVAREAAALAAGHGVEVIWTFCESHDRDIPFGVVARLLRAATGITDLVGPAARAKVRDRVPDVAAEDLLLLEDLLSVADPDIALPQIDPDARRRRLTSLVNAASLARADPALFIIEDAHWIDSVSESLLADFLAVIPKTSLMVLITSRPEYAGALLRSPGAQTITLAPLADSDTVNLLGVLLGSDPSVSELAVVIADRAAGNPFFAEEMVRELVQRGVLHGAPGNYVCHAEIAELSVPATVQAAIEARIDRLSAPAKRTLSAASVVGARFAIDLLSALVDPVLDELLRVELIDQVGFPPSAEYAFHHPLIRAVAYESQLKSDRVVWHRRLADAIEEGAPGLIEENAALIAEHLQAAGELRAAYGWHMRAAAWSAVRDLPAARISWERALRIADTLPADEADQVPMRIAPRTMLCVTAWQAARESRGRFAELRELCNAIGDKVSLAIGMTGQVTELIYSGRSREGSRLASEQMSLLESIGDSTLSVGLAPVPLAGWFDSGEFGEILRWSQTTIELARGDPTKGAGLGLGSPLAAALAWRGVARFLLGRPGWRQDLSDAVVMARNSDPTTHIAVVAWAYGLPIQYGVLQADDSAVRAIEEAVQIATESGNDLALSLAHYTLGAALLSRAAAADRQRGLALITRVRDAWLQSGVLFLVGVNELWAAREMARSGDRDGAIGAMRNAVAEMHRAGRVGYGIWATGVLAETLLDRGAEGDLAEAQQAIDWLTDLSLDAPSAVIDITLLRLRALLTRTHGDDVAFRSSVLRYRETAKLLNFEGHIASAEAM